MIQNRTKEGRLRLDPASYRRVWAKVLTRDGWRCQRCGCSSNLQLHHIMPRSALASDAGRNFITLFLSIHQPAHQQWSMSCQPSMVTRRLLPLLSAATRLRSGQISYYAPVQTSRSRHGRADRLAPLKKCSCAKGC